MAYMSYAGRLGRGKLIAKNLEEDPVIAREMRKFNYTPARVAEGVALVKDAEVSHRQVEEEYAEQLQATQDVRDLRAEAHEQFMVHRGIAGTYFKRSPYVRGKLGIDEPVPRPISGWIDRTLRFYQAALEDLDIQKGLAYYGVTQNDLEAGLAKVKAVETARAQQQREMGDAQNATKAREAAFDRMDEWVDDAISIARLALVDYPQKLEALLQTVPS